MSEETKKGEVIRHTSQLKYNRNEHKKFTDLIIMMLSSNTMPYYAEFNTFVNFYESTNIPTCGVNITADGMNFYWNRKFVDDLNEKEALFLLLHEDFHLLFDHTKRSITYNKKLANIVQDMIINQIIHDELMSHVKVKDKIEIPKFKNEFLMGEDGNPILDKSGNKIKNPFFGKNSGLFIPAEYTGEPIFENLYEWFKEKQEEYQKSKQQGDGQDGDGDDNNNGSGQNGKSNQKSSKKDKSNQKDNQKSDNGGNGDGEKDDDENNDNGGQGSGGQGDDGIPKDSTGKPSYGPYGQNGVECKSLESIFDSMENNEQMTLDNHLDDDVPENARKSIVDDFMQRLKNRGLTSSDVEKVLNKLRKSKHDYLKEIKRTISHHIFGASKRKSITKPNRRSIEGIKGKKKFKNVINCILDTSGSMGGDFERVLSFIFQNNIHVNLIQIDTEVKAVEDIKNKKDLQNLMIKGLGGTVLQPAITYVDDPKNNLYKYNTVILTDGYTDTLNFTHSSGKVLILTTGVKPKYNDPKGLVKSIEIDREKSIRG